MNCIFNAMAKLVFWSPSNWELQEAVVCRCWEAKFTSLFMGCSFSLSNLLTSPIRNISTGYFFKICIGRVLKTTKRPLIMDYGPRCSVRCLPEQLAKGKSGRIGWQLGSLTFKCASCWCCFFNLKLCYKNVLCLLLSLFPYQEHEHAHVHTQWEQREVKWWLSHGAATRLFFKHLSFTGLWVRRYIIKWKLTHNSCWRFNLLVGPTAYVAKHMNYWVVCWFSDMHWTLDFMWQSLWDSS